MVCSTGNFPYLLVLRQLLHLFHLKRVSRTAFVLLFSAQLSLPPSTNHQQFSRLCQHCCVGSSTADILDLLVLQIGYFSRQEHIRLLPVAQLAFVSKAPRIDRPIFGDHSSKIVSATDIHDLFPKLQLLGHLQILETVDTQLPEGIGSPDKDFSFVIKGH